MGVKKGKSIKGYSRLLCKNWKDSGEYKIDKAVVSIKKLKAGVISSHNLNSVIVNGDTIRLKDSWIELIILMLYTFIDDNSEENEFIRKSIEYGITNNNIHIEKTYGTVSFENKYSVWSIPNTDYYLEASLDNVSTLELIAKLMHVLGYDEDDIEFDISTDKEECEESIYSDRPEVMLLILLNEIYLRYGSYAIASIESVGNTGIDIEYCVQMRTDVEYERIADSQYFVYTDFDEADILEMINNLLEVYNV